MGNMAKVLEKLLDNTPLVLVFVGLVLFVVGAAGGWPKPELRIDEVGWRVALAIMGALVAGIGALLLLRKNSIASVGIIPANDINVKQYNFQITSPPEAIAFVDRHFDMFGRYDKKPSDLYSLEILEFDSTNYRHRKTATIKDDNTWEATHVWSSDTPGEQKIYVVGLANPGGQTLFAYYNMLEQGKRRPGMPNLRAVFKECARLRIVRR
jgi:hypothetical protein